MISKKRVPTGTSLKIYLTLLQSSEPLGVREIQVRVGLKSPSTVKYHLDRLRAEGLVKQLPDGRYAAIRSLDPITSLYIFFKSVPIPRLLPITLGMSSAMITYVVIRGILDYALIAMLIALCMYVLYEASKLVKLLRMLVTS